MKAAGFAWIDTLARMGFSARLLGEGESVVLHLRTHVKRLILPVLVLLLTAAAFGVGMALLPPSIQPVAGWILAGLAVLVVIIGVIVPFLRWATTTYTVTTRRIITRRGIVNRVGHDLLLMRINDVSYDRSLLDRILGCGTLHITTAAERPVVLPDVPDVEHVHVVIADLLFGTEHELRAEDA